MTRLYAAPRGQLAMFPGAKPEGGSRANRGMELEKQIIAMNELYRQLGEASVDKTDVRTQVVGSGQWARVVGRGRVDFIGTLKGGRAVAFDAKDCEGPRISLDRLEEHQLAYLGQVLALGGLAFVLVRFERAHVYRVPADVWVDADLHHRYGEPVDRVDGWAPRNRASLTMADMRPEWAVKDYDWLGVIGL